MPSEYELSDINVKYRHENSVNGESTAKMSNGFYITTAKAFILVFLALAIAVGVGIIVHFAGPARDVECKCTFPTTGDGSSGGETAALEQCKTWASEGNSDICSACPSQGSSATCPTVPTAPTAPTQATKTTTPPQTTPTSVATTTATPAVLDVRLPTALNPLLYTVELQPHMYTMNSEEFTFNGSVRILFHCVEDANNITLHINKLNITGSISVTHENEIEGLYNRHEFDTARQFIIIYTTKELMAGQNYTVDITSFVGPLVPDLAGLYLSSYTRGDEKIYIATSQMQPTDARKTFPCLDEPAIKSEFEVTLVRKRHMKSISNMPITNKIDRGDDWIADKFQRTPKMSTYLLAFIICDFNYTENTTENGVTYRAWARPEAIEQTPYSLKVGVEILTFFEEYFSISYPLPKQDMIAIPDFAAGAMENWGLITYRETAMLYEAGVSSEGNKQRVAVVVSHELAHQWFGNLVTPSWWDDLWLNEGFASYVEYMGVDHVHPDWKMFEQFVVEDLQDVFNFDGLISSHPVYVPVAHPDEINEIFDRISYAKGASIIRMMRFFLGDATFQHGLTRYLNSLRYGAAFHDDLWFALGNQSLAESNPISNVKEIMDTWTLQMNYPVVTIMHGSSGSITLKQHRYLQDPNATDPGKYTSPFGYKWNIPFTYTTSTEKRFDVTSNDVIMMSKDEPSIPIDNANIPAATGNNWVLGNPMQYGYYRVNYDERNWIALIEQLRSDHSVVHAINRAQIINDAWSLARSGDLGMSLALRTTEYLNNEREWIPWSAASSQLGFVGSMLERHPLYGSFTKFMQNKTSSAFEELTMNNTGASHLESYLRSTITSLACSYGIQACVDEAKQLYSQWMRNPNNNPIDPGIKSTVYCVAIAEGGIDEWEFAWNQYQTANVAAEKSRLLSALSCSKETWILSRYLDMAIDPNQIRRQDSVSVIVYISRNTIGRSLAWDFFRAKWDFLLNDYFEGISYVLSGLINNVLASFNTEFELTQLKAFVDSKDDLGSGARAFAQALEKTQSNINWMTANVPVIESWLHDQGY
ncbi:aminopeptidase N-like isoform X1 [Mercenaria mercenaria]|uniref:aminopeptidase N-like isoform X1 n=1 Tax=Mercenaria mercenaria TaxID=6596 RepID=UPI00234F314C|nr:aminopeptidase N-like isoform X1 [Mercenaria mercenaria]